MKQDYLQIKMLEVADQVFASPQLFEADLSLIEEQGARSIVDLLPDNNATPRSKSLEQAASEHGIRFVHFPIAGGAIDTVTAAAFAEVCAELERPLIVCSHSGAHAAKVWELAERESRT